MKLIIPVIKTGTHSFVMLSISLSGFVYASIVINFDMKINYELQFFYIYVAIAKTTSRNITRLRSFVRVRSIRVSKCM